MADFNDILVNLAWQFIQTQLGAGQPGSSTDEGAQPARDSALLNLKRKAGAVCVLLGTRETGKCVEVSTPICLSDGRIKSAGSCIAGDKILALGTDLKIRPTSVLASENLGLQKCLRLTLRSGRKITTTPEHPFYTVLGWVPSSELNLKSRIATARELQLEQSHRSDVEEHKIKVLAYLLGDGYMPLASLCTSNKDMAADYVSACEKFDNIQVVARYRGTPTYAPKKAQNIRRKIDVTGLSYKNKTTLETLYNMGYSACELGYSFHVISETINKWLRLNHIPVRKQGSHGTSQINSVAAFLKDLGLQHSNSETKFIPNFVFSLPDTKLALFLRVLFSTDGYVSGGTIEYCSKSYKMCCQIQHLLLRQGIRSTIGTGKSKLYGKPCGQCSNLVIRDVQSLKKFINFVGPIIGKEEKLQSLALRLENVKSSPVIDNIPKDVWTYLTAAEHGKYGKFIHTNYNPGRSTVLTIAELTSNLDLGSLATSDIFWDEIVAIDKVDVEVCDLMTSEQNFLANDVVVHNTQLAYRLAEFLGRPTYAVSPQVTPPSWIKKIKLQDIFEVIPPKSTLICDDLPAYASNRDYNNELIQNLERVVPMVRHERQPPEYPLGELQLIFCSQSSAQADKYILDCDVAFFKPLGMLYEDFERQNIKRIYRDYVNQYFEGKGDDWVHKHVWMRSREYNGGMAVNLASPHPEFQSYQTAGMT